MKKESNAEEKSPVRYDGEFVLIANGSRDFGEIKAETGLEEGKIRLRTGKQADEKGDYGEKHRTAYKYPNWKGHRPINVFPRPSALIWQSRYLKYTPSGEKVKPRFQATQSSSCYRIYRIGTR